MKKVLKVILIILLAIIALAVLLLGYLTIREYNPADVTPAETRIAGVTETVSKGDTLNIVSWNIGYASLGKERDFVMDGGGNAPACTKEDVLNYLDKIKSSLDYENTDIFMFQETDTKASRSFFIDQRDYLSAGNDAFALNYCCDFVPFPWPPFGFIRAGVTTTSGCDLSDSIRVSLPCPFSWPLRTANLKRCLLVSYIPVEGSDSKLVIVNHHLEAYDDGEGKIAQTRQLREFCQSEYEKGNWVIAGGDWNQGFPGSTDIYPNNHPDLWEIGWLDDSTIPEGFQFAYDLTTPSCRLLNQPYNPADTANTQYYVIDGFILSPNIELNSVETLDKDFANSDHNPVHLEVTLK